DLVHVGDPVAADVVDAHIEHVRALAYLLARHLDARVVVGIEHRVAELLRSVCVRALTDDEERHVLLEWYVRVDRRASGLVEGYAWRGRAAADALDETREVLRRGAATTPDDVDAELGDESLLRVGQSLGREVVVRVAVDDRRQTRVRETREE